FGVVDDSIYALQDEYAPDIRKHFIHRRGIEVATSTSLQYYDYGQAHEKRRESETAAKPAAEAAAPGALRAAAKSDMNERDGQAGGGEGEDRAGGGGGATVAR